MIEYAYQMKYDLAPMVDRIAAQIQHKVDQVALDKIANTLEQYGYVKVMRCRDCKFGTPSGTLDYVNCFFDKENMRTFSDFCSWGK